MKKRNAIISCVFALVLLGPLLMMGATRGLHLSLPEWLSPQSAVWLLGGHSNTSIRASLNFEGIFTGKLQSTLEDKVEDYVPCKKTALLLPAALQRNIISASNAAFGWEVYPTFYGSSYLFIPGQHAIAEKPFRPNTAFLEKLETFVQQLSSLAQAYPETRFCLVLADQSNVSLANPAFRLVDGAWSSADYVAKLAGDVAEIPNVAIVAKEYEDTELFYHDFYRGDHHWNGYGALETYEELAKRYGLPVEQAQQEYETAVPGLQDVIENGSYARSGLAMVNEHAQEPDFDLSDLVLEEGAAAAVLTDDLAKLFSQGGSVEHNFYEAWYGYRGVNRFYNQSGASGSALLVCDSFGTAIKYPLACGLERLDVAYSIHAEVRDAPSLASMLKEMQPEMVLFVGRVDNYASALSRCPRLFELNDGRSA